MNTAPVSTGPMVTSSVTNAERRPLAVRTTATYPRPPACATAAGTPRVQVEACRADGSARRDHGAPVRRDQTTTAAIAESARRRARFWVRPGFSPPLSLARSHRNLHFG